MELLTRDKIDTEIAGHSLRDIVNYNEYAVARVLRELLSENLSLCQCRFCVEDVYALSLNSLPPRYIQSSSVRTYEESENYLPEDAIRRKVQEAATKVRKRPNHPAA